MSWAPLSGDIAVKSLNVFARLRIGGRIYLGFFVCLALLGLLGVLGVESFKSIEGSHAYFARISQNSLNISRSERDFTGLRRNTSVYMLTGDTAVLDRARDLYAKIRQDMARIAEGIAVPARKAEFQDIAKQIDEYWSLFEQAMKMRTAREKLVNEKLELAGTMVREGISQVSSNLMADENYEAAALAGQATESFMLARTSAIRYATGDRKAGDNFKSDFDGFRIIFSQAATRAKD